MTFYAYSAFMVYMHSRPISRMAPTPNGELHWGNLMNFALTWAHVRKGHGKLWLRFDDIDIDRCEERYAEDTRTTLSYLGLNWDEEYSHQIGHIEEYRVFLEKIPHYVCKCSRQDILNRTGDYHYDGHCRDLKLRHSPGKNAVRFLSPVGPAHDFVLWRREDLPAYHLTCVHDEEMIGINLIIRGEDLLETTEVQKELSRSLPGDPLSKITFIHHPLILGPDGQKLSKSRKDGDILSLIKQGKSAQEIWQELGTLMGTGLLRGAGDLL